MRTLILLIGVLPVLAVAHQQSTSYGSWMLQESGGVFVLRVSQLDLTRARLHPADPRYTAALHAYVQAGVSLQRGEQECTLDGIRSDNAEPGWLRVRMTWSCERVPEPYAIRFSALFEWAPNHVHLAAIRAGDGRLHSRVFSAGREVWQSDPQAQPSVSGFPSYFRLGVQHILEGWDHLCFLLALVLFVRRWQTLAWLITGFTVGHSATLALAALGVATPAARSVEWIIAFSILALAVENVWRQEQQQGNWPLVLLAVVAVAGVAGSALTLLTTAGLCLFVFAYLELLRQRAAPAGLGVLMTIAFGLFHGFGFAGVLGELSIPPDQLLFSLLAFNLGVEAGQLFAIALVYPLLYWVQRQHASWLHLPNALASAAACYWLVQRSLG